MVQLSLRHPEQRHGREKLSEAKTHGMLVWRHISPVFHLHSTTCAAEIFTPFQTIKMVGQHLTVRRKIGKMEGGILWSKERIFFTFSDPAWKNEWLQYKSSKDCDPQFVFFLLCKYRDPPYQELTSDKSVFGSFKIDEISIYWNLVKISHLHERRFSGKIWKFCWYNGMESENLFLAG